MTLASDQGEVAVSVLVPAHDEAENLPTFVDECERALQPLPYRCEVVVVDDGSLDDTPRVLDELKAARPYLRVVTHRTRLGIADALRSGAEAARGDILVFYPADLQFLPAEIPRLVEPIAGGDADLVTGTKQGAYERRFVSGIYNRLCRWLFGIRVTDLNAVKAFRREVMEAVPARPDWHRFMVVIAAADGFRVTERPVTLRPRRAGRSKFGLGRIPVGAVDLLSVWFQLRFGRKPLAGGVSFTAGLLVGIGALVLRFGYGLGFRPLLDLVMVLVIAGIVLFGIGFVGELLAASREETRVLQKSVDRLLAERRRRP